MRDQHDMRNLCKKLVEDTVRFGADAADAVCIQRAGIEANVFEGEVDSFVQSLSRGAGVRAIIGGRVGYAYTENLEEIESVARAAVQSAGISDPQPGAGIYEGQGVSGCTTAPPLDDSALVTKLAKDLHDATMAQGAHSLQACQAESALQHVWFANSAGVACEDCQKYAVLFVEPVAKIDDYVDSNYAFAAGTELGPLDIGDVAKRAVERAMQYRGAKQVKGGSMPVVIKADAMAEILGAFAPMFSADSAQKGLSLLKGKEGTAIASELVTLVDSPDHPQLGFGYAFDGEGVPATKKNVIDHGVLTTLLYDVASANRQGVESTGNARRSYSSTVSISPFHFYVVPGAALFDDLLREAKDGIIVAEVSGLHAGVNPTSGDFSLLAKGFALSGGEQGAPIDQMVLSGNFHALLKGIRLLSNDLTFGLPGGSCFGSPSVLVDNLVVASD